MFQRAYRARACTGLQELVCVLSPLRRVGWSVFAVELPGGAFDMPVSSLVESEDAAGVT